MAANSRTSLTILGHRGAILDRSALYQNSLGAFTEAVAAADGFETDACVDRDGEVFLIHETKDIGFGPAFEGVKNNANEHLNAASAALLGDRRIDQMTTADMRRLRLQDGSPVPTLREAIELIGGRPEKILNIELKAYDVARHVLRIVRESLGNGMTTPHNMIISSFNHAALQDIRQDMPELRLGALFNYPDAPMRPLFPWQPESTGDYMPLTAEGLDTDILKCVRPDYITIPQEILTRENIAMIGEYHPAAKCAGWVFTEKGHFDMPEFLTRLDGLLATGKMAAMIVDNPRAFAKILRG